MNAVRNCKVVYVQTEDGFEGESTNFNLGRHSAETTNKLAEIFRRECAELLNINYQFVSIQINRVRKL